MTLKNNSSLAGESCLFWPGICLSLLLFYYWLQVTPYCISPAGLEASMLLKGETQIIAVRDGQKCWGLGGGEETPYPALQVQATLFFRIEQNTFKSLCQGKTRGGRNSSHAFNFILLYFFGSKMINNHSPNLLLSNKYLMLARSYEF